MKYHILTPDDWQAQRKREQRREWLRAAATGAGLVLFALIIWELIR